MAEDLFELPGLSVAADRLFSRLLRAYALAPEAVINDAAEVRELLDAGLAVLTDTVPGGKANPAGPYLLAMPPENPASRLLLAREREEHARMEALMQLREEIPGLRATFDAARGTVEPADLVSLVAGRAEVEAARQMVVDSARTELSCLNTGTLLQAENEEAEAAALPLAEDAPGPTRRSIYDHSVHGEHEALIGRALAQRDAIGERQRIVPALPLSMVLADETLALITLTPASNDGALLFRSKRVLAMLRMYFEMLWDSAHPLGGRSDELASADLATEIPLLLVSGLKDQAVAVQLGVAVRTVRRRVAELQKSLGARSRFEAGVLAERAGFHPRGVRTPADSELGVVRDT